MIDSNILTSFIQEKLRKYDEPQREGSRRGEPIGASIKKYHAAMLVLTDKTLEEIADEVGVSHGTVRNWNSDEEFKNLTSELANSFIAYYMSQISWICFNQYAKGRQPVTFETLKNLLLQRLKLKSIRNSRGNAKLSEYRQDNVESLFNEAISILSTPNMNEKQRKEVLSLLYAFKYL
jgi:transcriptional regulator with XRE-family HTH domain